MIQVTKKKEFRKGKRFLKKWEEKEKLNLYSEKAENMEWNVKV